MTPPALAHLRGRRSPRPESRAMPIGGLAYRGSDAVVVSATPGVPVELLAYYLFHELGHCWDAYDIPFRGGDTTFGSKPRMTFDVDAGNEEIMENSPGPLRRATPNRAPMVIRESRRALAPSRATCRCTVWVRQGEGSDLRPGTNTGIPDFTVRNVLELSSLLWNS